MKLPAPPSWACWAALWSVACDGGSTQQPTAAPSPPAEQRSQQPASGQPAQRPPDQAALSAAISTLSVPLTRAAADPDNAWALAHGVLAFGPGFKTRDDELAVDRLGSFVEVSEHAGQARLSFPRQHDGLPVEPHPHIIARALLQAGVDLDRALAGGSSRPTLRRLLVDLRAEQRLPTTDDEWRQLAWGMDAVTLANGAVEPVAGLRQAALARLEIEQRVVDETTGPAAAAMRSDSPMGAAKRAKRHIFSHACGGLHLAQAVFRSVGRQGDAAEKRRAMRQLSALGRRFEAERLLYRAVLQQRPRLALMISRQQLKFFGHLVETLADADGLCQTDADRQTLARLRDSALVELVATVERLERLDAYGKLESLEVQDRQTYLDLIGDGCHALRALKLNPPPEGTK